jgi:hypothetical protein
LSGTFSSQWSALVKLQTINLASNSITGTVPNLAVLARLRSL